jgi:hypothetical protein
MEFAYDGGGLAKGGNVTLYYDGTAVGTGRVGATQPMIFSADETTDIGYESGTTVTPDYTAGSSRFTGKINWVQIDLGNDDHDHYIDPDERLRIAIARPPARPPIAQHQPQPLLSSTEAREEYLDRTIRAVRSAAGQRARHDGPNLRRRTRTQDGSVEAPRAWFAGTSTGGQPARKRVP